MLDRFRVCPMWAVVLFISVLSVISSVRAQGTPKDFTLPALDGSKVALSDFLGKQTVVLNFWAAWCDTCEEEVPDLARLQQGDAGDAVFIGINAGDSENAAKKFVARTKYPYKVLFDADKAVSKSYGVLGLPRTIIIAKSGLIVYSESRPPATIPDSVESSQ